MIDYNFLKKIRLEELKVVLSHVPKNGKLLEIGSGAGWQSNALYKKGYAVTAIDVADSLYADKAEFSVMCYDGEHIPFPDNSFDIVFTSNTLEHIQKIVEVDREIERVLRSDGIVVHAVPTAPWKVWSLIAYYPASMIKIFRMLAKQKIADSEKEEGTINMKKGISSGLFLLRYLVAPRHGAIGSSLSEIVRFRSMKWEKFFRLQGWHLEEKCFNNIFYTGFFLFGKKIKIKNRNALSKVLGSSCAIFILRKKGTKRIYE